MYVSCELAERFALSLSVVAKVLLAMHASDMALGMAMSVCRLVYHFGPGQNISTTFGWRTLEPFF